MREATRIAHLDHSDPDWTHAFTTNPAQAAGFAAPSLEAGAPADLVICKARTWTELFARPQTDRLVLRGGRPLDRDPPRLRGARRPDGGRVTARPASRCGGPPARVEPFSQGESDYTPLGRPVFVRRRAVRPPLPPHGGSRGNDGVIEACN